MKVILKEGISMQVLQEGNINVKVVLKDRWSLDKGSLMLKYEGKGMTLWLMMPHNNTRFGDKKFCG